MATLELPVRNDTPSYRFQLVLEGSLYFFGFRFNTRMNRWIMDLQNEAQIELIRGIPVLADMSVLDGYTKEGMPPGIFVVVDLANQGRHPDLTNFGIDLKLYYQESV